MAKKLKSYMFDVGNSSTGPIGMVIRVKAYTRKEALEKAQAVMETNTDDCCGYDMDINEVPGCKYGRVYLSPENLKFRHICADKTEEVDEGQELS